MSAGAWVGLAPGSRVHVPTEEPAQGQPQQAVPEAVAETPVTRWILSPRGKPPGPLPVPSVRGSTTRSGVRLAECRGTKVRRQYRYWRGVASLQQEGETGDSEFPNG